MNRKTRRRVFTILLIAIVTAGTLAGTQIQYRFGKAVGRDGVVYVPTGSNLDRLIDSLSAHDLLRNPAAFRRAAGRHALDTNLKSGRYELRKGTTYAALVNRFKSGAQNPVRVTFNNLRTVDRLAGAVSRQLELDSLSLLQALLSDTVAASYGYTVATFPVMFIPDTYEFYWNTSVKNFLIRMKRESTRFWEKRAAKLQSCKLSESQVFTLASIVYEETKKNDEMPRVAGVYLNRLRIGMPLQADPTVKYALGDFSLKRVLLRHLEVDSPYNTYRYAGLPPGPICMPSVVAIDAVLQAEHHKYLYFCAREDLSGYHNFAVTLAQHNLNAQAYARALDRLNIR